MCTGRLDLSFVLRGFTNGVDAVFIAGCHLNECNYITHGNFRALSMVHLGQKLLERLGINPNRLRMELISGGEGTRFAELMNEYGREVRQLGPLGKGEGIDEAELKAKLDSATQLVPYLRLFERERLRLRLKTEQEYEEFFASEEFTKLFDQAVGEPLTLSQITLLLQRGPLSTAEIAAKVGLTPSAVSRHMNTASRHRLVRYDMDQKRYALA